MCTGVQADVVSIGWFYEVILVSIRRRWWQVHSNIQYRAQSRDGARQRRLQGRQMSGSLHQIYYTRQRNKYLYFLLPQARARDSALWIALQSAAAPKPPLIRRQTNVLTDESPPIVATCHSRPSKPFASNRDITVVRQVVAQSLLFCPTAIRVSWPHVNCQSEAFHAMHTILMTCGQPLGL